MVGADDGSRARPAALGQQVHERFLAVGGLPRRPNRCSVGAGSQTGGRRREDAAWHRRERRREADLDMTSGGPAQPLFDLRDVPVRAADAIGTHGAHRLRPEQMRLRRPTGAGDPGRGHDDDILRLEQACRVPRHQRQQARRWVAAGNGDAPGAGQADAAAGQFGQPVGPDSGVLGSVEVRPGAGGLESVVRADVQHEDVGIRGRQGLSHRRAGPVRQGQDHHVVSAEDLGRGRMQRHRRQGVQVGLDLVEALPGLGVRGDRLHVNIGVGGEQAQHLAAGVPAGSCHGC